MADDAIQVNDNPGLTPETVPEKLPDQQEVDATEPAKPLKGSFRGKDEGEILNMIRQRFIIGRSGPNSCAQATNNITNFIYDNQSGYKVPLESDPPTININLFIVAIENLVSLLSDTPLSITVVPKKPDTDLDAILYSQIIEWILSTNRWDQKRPLVQKNMAIYGTGFIKLLEDEHLGIKLKLLDPRLVVMDPHAQVSVDEANWIIEIAQFTREQLQEQYPDAEIYTDASSTADPVTTQKNWEYNQSEWDRNLQLISVYECWTKDDEYIVCTDWQILERRDNEMRCGFPYIAFPWYILPDRLFGMDTMRGLKPILDEINNLYKRLSIIIRKTANPQKLVSTIEGPIMDKLTNEDGLVIPIPREDVHGAMEWAPSPEVPQIYAQYLEKLEMFFQMISGVQDVSMGQGQVGAQTPSGKSLETMAEAAQTRIREVFRNIKNATSSLGRKIMMLIPQIFTTDQVIRITGQDVQDVQDALDREKNRIAKQIAQAGAETPEEIQKGVGIYQKEEHRNLIGTEPSVGYMHFNGSKLFDAAEFDVEVNGGLDVPKTKLDIQAQAMQLLQEGQCDIGTYLTITEFPYKDLIIKNSQQYQAFLAWQQAGMPPPQAPATPPLPPKTPSISMKFPDLPPDAQQAALAQAGLAPTVAPNATPQGQAGGQQLPPEIQQALQTGQVPPQGGQ